VLAGVAIASFLTAVQTYVQQRDTEDLRKVYTWILGRLSTSTWSEVQLIAPYAVVCGIAMVLLAGPLDVLAVGEEEAATLGVRPARVRVVALAAASLAAAAAVSVSGLIAFVGIVVPHAVRRVAGVSHRRVVPLSMLFGGAFLAGADIVARTLRSPAELPIGVVTAFIGAPFFLQILRRQAAL
jgi:iron complex transport system permease protein